MNSSKTHIANQKRSCVLPLLWIRLLLIFLILIRKHSIKLQIKPMVSIIQNTIIDQQFHCMLTVSLEDSSLAKTEEQNNKEQEFFTKLLSSL